MEDQTSPPTSSAELIASSLPAASAEVIVASTQSDEDPERSPPCQAPTPYERLSSPLDCRTPVASPSQRDVEEGVAITWKDLVVKTKAGRVLLDGLNGVAVPGMLTALMGASGAGKTTLLNTLLCRNLKGLDIQGEILVNGQEVGRGVTEVSSYVQQEDMFTGTLTVGEHLHMQANMRLPNNWSSEEKKERVKQVARDMLLENSMSTRIGVPGLVKGISGGELKRLAFATELLSDPPVLFADEPTTGLDSHMAMLVAKSMESLSGDQGKTIVCTIHQPASEIFEMFDRVLFLANGRTAFFGTPPEAVAFFSRCGYVIPHHTNPADHYIHTLAMLPGQEDKCKEKCKIICDKFEKSALKRRMKEEMNDFSQPRPLEMIPKVTWFILFSMLLCRFAKDNLRKKALFRAKFIQKIAMGLFLGLLYLQTAKTQEGIMNMNGVLFYFCSELTYSTVFGIQPYVPADYPLLVREFHDGLYPVSAYIIARIFSYLMVFSLDGSIMVLISYFIIGLVPTAGRLFMCLLIALFVEISAASVGIAICSLAPSYTIAVSVTGPLLTLLSMTGGIFMNVATIPAWIRWVQYLSSFRFGYESFVVSQYTHEKFNEINCTYSETTGEQIGSCFHSGHEIIENLNFKESNLVGNMFIMVLYTVLVYCIAYVALVVRVIRSR